MSGYSMPNMYEGVVNSGDKRRIKSGHIYTRTGLRRPPDGVRTIDEDTRLHAWGTDWVKMGSPLDSNDYGIWTNRKLHCIVVYDDGEWRVLVGLDHSRYVRLLNLTIKQADLLVKKRQREKQVVLGPRKIVIRDRD